MKNILVTLAMVLAPLRALSAEKTQRTIDPLPSVKRVIETDPKDLPHAAWFMLVPSDRHCQNKVFATTGGTITQTRPMLIIKSDDGVTHVWYGHLKIDHRLHRHTVVRAGDIIGVVPAESSAHRSYLLYAVHLVRQVEEDEDTSSIDPDDLLPAAMLITRAIVTLFSTTVATGVDAVALSHTAPPAPDRQTLPAPSAAVHQKEKATATPQPAETPSARRETPTPTPAPAFFLPNHPVPTGNAAFNTRHCRKKETASDEQPIATKKDAPVCHQHQGADYHAKRGTPIRWIFGSGKVEQLLRWEQHGRATLWLLGRAGKPIRYRTMQRNHYGGPFVAIHNARILVRMFHALFVPQLKVGDVVAAGDIVGYVDRKGVKNAGAHLHVEIWIDGKPVDPEVYLRQLESKPVH